jgi:metal-responsive CopG/Arc/MetJ family transcriptional regulator
MIDMATVRTAISLDEHLFREMDDLARSMKVSRSELFARAASDYVRRQESRAMLEQINRAYAEEPDADERDLRSHMEALRRRVAGEEKW